MRGKRTHRLRGSAATLVAFGASVAVHVAVIALLLPESSVPPPRRRAVPFEVELRSAPAAAAPAAPGPRPGDSRRAEAVPRTPAPAGEPAAPGALRADGPKESALEAPALRRPPDLSVRWPGIASSEGGAGRGDAGATAPSRDVLGDWAREQAGRARVESGAVHPYYQDVGRALLGAWDPTRTIERRGVAGYVAQAGDNVRTFGRVWQRVAKGFARSGAPALIDGGSPRMKELSGLPAGPARDALVAAEVRRQLRPAFAQGHVAVVRVTQAKDGRLISVELVSPSSDAEIDRAALEDVRAAALALPPPPAEALAGRETLVSMWELELEISISPPLPVVEVEFDEVLGLKDVRLPLDRRVWKRVRLVAVL